MKSFGFNPDKCDLCHKCEEACIKFLQQKRQNYFFPPLRVALSDRKPFLLVCRQCEDAPCVDACIAGAMQKKEGEEFILYDESKCLGCMMCSLVCPWGAVIPLYNQKKVLKCSGICGERKPACVDSCDRYALFFEDPREATKKKRVFQKEKIPVEKIR